MKTISRASYFLVGAAILSSTPLWAALPNAKVAELGLHRIERLVILKKIEEGYQTKFKGISVQVLTPGTPADPSFQVNSTQWPAADASQKTLMLGLDATGKEISHAVAGALDPVAPPTWPAADAITIAENSLHWLEDKFGTDPRLLPYYNGATKLALSQASDGAGGVLAFVDFQVAPAGAFLRITMKSDGIFSKWEILP